LSVGIGIPPVAQITWGAGLPNEPMPMGDTARIGDEGKVAGSSDLPAALLSELSN
jgi:hypothetical protein